MQISFGDGAFDAYVTLAQQIPTGTIVALLPDMAEPPNTPDLVPDVDVSFVSADHEGVTFQYLDPANSEPYGGERTRLWESVARIHVY